MKASLPLLLFISFNTFAQNSTLPIDGATHLITYTEIVKASGNKDELYSRSKEWFAKTYNSAQRVIQMDDKESGKIVGKAMMQVYDNGDCGYINYTISISVKDGKYKYEINNFYHTGEDRYPYLPIPDYGLCENMMHPEKKRFQKTFNNILNQMDTNIKELIKGIKVSMNVSDSF